MWGPDPRPQLGQRRPEVVWPRGRAAAVVVAPLRCLVAAREKGKGEREPRGSYLGPWPGWGGSEVLRSRERAAAGSSVRGGGAAG